MAIYGIPAASRIKIQAIYLTTAVVVSFKVNTKRDNWCIFLSRQSQVLAGRKGLF